MTHNSSLDLGVETDLFSEVRKESKVWSWCESCINDSTDGFVRRARRSSSFVVSRSVVVFIVARNR